MVFSNFTEIHEKSGFLPLFAKRKISPIFYNLRGGLRHTRKGGSFRCIANLAVWRGLILPSKLGKNRDFSHILLCAKFNRFFIILGGGGRPAENRDFRWFWGLEGSHILGFGPKNHEKR